MRIKQQLSTLLAKVETCKAESTGAYLTWDSGGGVKACYWATFAGISGSTLDPAELEGRDVQGRLGVQ